MTMSSMLQRAPRPAEPDLPPYPHHYAAPSVASQVEHRAGQWGMTARALRDEIAATEDALIAALDEQDRREANRARLRAALDANTDRGLR